MSKPNLNLVIFDDDENIDNQMQTNKYTEKSNKVSHSKDKVDKLDVISKELIQLQEKIYSIEKQGNKIRDQLSNKNQQNVSNNAPANSNLKEIQHVLSIMEKKIKLILQETKTIYTKMENNFIKKLKTIIENQPKTAVQPQSNSNQIKQQIQAVYASKVEQCQNYYQNQYQKLMESTKKKEESMIQRLSQIQQRYMNKINQFETKQKQYVDWIHHLQAKLKDRKSKKMITITQQKPQISIMPSKQTVVSNQNIQSQSNVENVPLISAPSNVNCSIQQGSKIIRKHKIFGNKSVSPAPKADVSPTRDSQLNAYEKSSVQNHNHNPLKEGYSDQQLHQDSKKNLGFYHQLKSGTQNQFYRDLPKPNSGWDNFADMNDYNQSYTDSESDDFFAPVDGNQSSMRQRMYNNIPLESKGNTQYGQGFKNHKFGSVTTDQNQERVFSPFDLN